MADDNLRLLTVKEVAERLRLHPITVRRHIKAGRIRAVRIGRAVRVPEGAIAAGGAVDSAWRGKLPYHWPLTSEEKARLKKIVARMRASRARTKPLDMTTAELVRQGRNELDERAERHIGHRR